MICKCKETMKLVFIWDDAQETDHAYNLWACHDCGLMCKEDVWEHKGIRWIGLDGNLTIENEESENE